MPVRTQIQATLRTIDYEELGPKDQMEYSGGFFV